ncbi:MAG: Uma2 family endonuclease [Caldilineaceae bacterium]
MCAAVASHPPIAKPQDIPRDLKLWRLSVEQYHEMARAGVLTEDDPVELLEGWLVYKVTKNPPHSAATHLVKDALEQLVPAGWHIRSQDPITLADSEPEPDVAIIQGDIRRYVERHPSASETPLVVEVSDSTLEQDRNTKMRIYAQAQIPVYWIVNLVEDCVEVYTNPSIGEGAADYNDCQIYEVEDEIPVQVNDRLFGILKVADLLP